MRPSLRLLAAASALALACASNANGLLPDDGAAGPSDGGFDGAIDVPFDAPIGAPFDTPTALSGDAAAMDAPPPADAAADATADASDGGRPCRATEVCNNGLDDDCNGAVDDRCACLPGDQGPCYRGPVDTWNVGRCRSGVMLCLGTGEFGMWGACVGDALPAAEVCDPGGVDENCNGAANEGCECAVGADPRLCGSTVGTCRAGTQACADGHLAACLGATGPAPEQCDGLDNDCNGMTDEGLARPCGSSLGTCRLGQQRCAAGAWGVCADAILPMAESCNGLDDDCNGMVDDNVTRPCGSSVGACRSGTQRCAAGAWAACAGSVGASPELCDGVDNDCNGAVDDGLRRACGSAVGVCRPGTQQCSSGAWGPCAGSIMPTAEVCDGALDENCDGAVDERCGCTRGATRPCGSTVGACRAGTQTCGADGQWGAVCAGQVGPSADACDGVDNNCDGTVDEGCLCAPGATQRCYAGPAGTAGVGVCTAGSQRCAMNPSGAGSAWSACGGEVVPGAEVCNGRDDNCNGAVDEGDLCPAVPPMVMCPAAVSAVSGQAVTLSAGASDPAGDPLTFTWAVSARPTGSTAVPAMADARSTVFVPDAPGAWVLQFCARDRRGVACCTVSLTVAPSCVAPADPAATSCDTSWDRRPIVQFNPLPSGVVYEVWRAGDAAPLGTVSVVGQNYFRPAAAIDAGAAPPGGAVTLYVRACRGGDRACCATSATSTVRLIQTCTAPVTPTPTNVVFSEYLIDGNGGACPGPTCEAGESIEITNLSHCPVSLDGYHFAYRSAGAGSVRWMNFTAADVIPPRGVYVAIRNQSASTCAFPFFGPDDPALFGLRISRLTMQGTSLDSGWFNNAGGGSSELRIASGAFVDFTAGTTIALISPYRGGVVQCSSTGFDAVGACGAVAGGAVPTTTLTPNQLGRLWHPCDAVRGPVPAACR